MLIDVSPVTPELVEAAVKENVRLLRLPEKHRRRTRVVGAFPTGNPGDAVDLHLDRSGARDNLGHLARTPAPSVSWLRWWGRCADDGGNEHRRLGHRIARDRLSRQASPREQLLRHQPMPACDLRHDGVRRQRFLDNPCFVVRRELPPPARSRDHLNPPQRRPRLKRMVKLRHKPISDSEIAHSPAAAFRKRWGQNSANAPAHCRQCLVEQAVSQHRTAERPSDDSSCRCLSQDQVPLSPNRKCGKFWTLRPSEDESKWA